MTSGIKYACLVLSFFATLHNPGCLIFSNMTASIPQVGRTSPDLEKWFISVIMWGKLQALVKLGWTEPFQCQNSDGISRDLNRHTCAKFYVPCLKFIVACGSILKDIAWLDLFLNSQSGQWYLWLNLLDRDLLISLWNRPIRSAMFC